MHGVLITSPISNGEFKRVKVIDVYYKNGVQTEMHVAHFAIILINIINQPRVKLEKTFLNSNKQCRWQMKNVDGACPITPFT